MPVFSDLGSLQEQSSSQPSVQQPLPTQQQLPAMPTQPGQQIVISAGMQPQQPGEFPWPRVRGRGGGVLRKVCQVSDVTVS